MAFVIATTFFLLIAWTLSPIAIFFDYPHLLKDWEKYSRRQKLLIGLITGPIGFIIAIFDIIYLDTTNVRKVIWKYMKYYFNLLK